MTLALGTRLGPYEIAAPIGAGGMGEVYRARDSKLNRDVAIKVLPAEFASDSERVARFKREAQVLASLNHPNIAGIYGLEEVAGIASSASSDGLLAMTAGAGSTIALVMELVEGDDLSTLIARGAIPVAEALPIARQIAEALEAAHEQGIVHRDLKPGNIKVRTDGTIKVLDFGLAKAMDSSGVSNPNVSHSPTLTHQGTQLGMIIGTAAYMSPEQAKGRPVDKRADIWSFGVVLYEMLTGKRAFRGEDVSDTLASVLKDKLPMEALPEGTPPRLQRVIERCLERDLKNRLRDIGEARFELSKIESGAPDATMVTLMAAPVISPSPASRAPWVIAAVTSAALMAALVLWAPWRAKPALLETRLDVATPPTSDPVSFAVSPDGRNVVFLGSATDGQGQLFLRSMDSTTPRPLDGTEGAVYPFWSPDSRSIGFFTPVGLKRLDLGGGLPQSLAELRGPRGGTWNSDGTIVVGLINNPLFKVSAAGGAPTPVTKLAPGQISHRWPHFLPDGRRFVFHAQGSPSGIFLGSLDSPESRKILDADSAAQFVEPDWLLFLRQGALVAQRVDLKTGTLVGAPTSVADHVSGDSTRFAGGFSVASSGLLTYRTGRDVESQFTWFDRSGKVVDAIRSPDATGLYQPTLSPDGHRVAGYHTVQGNVDLWLIEGGRVTRLTTDVGREMYPAWSPDGSQVAFAKDFNGALALFRKAPAGGGAEERLRAASGRDVVPQSWSSDGRYLLFIERSPATAGDLWALPLDGKQSPIPVAKSKFEERHGQFSPDGRSVAYASDESGRFEIYVRPFPGPGAPILVSTAGGIAPRWRKDGKELYYIAPDSSLMAVAVATTSGPPQLGAPFALFRPRILLGGTATIGYQAQYDVAPDGRFLINVTAGADLTAPITVIQNWAPEARR